MIFKKGESYWLEYMGDNKYIGRSDNIFGSLFIIPPDLLISHFGRRVIDCKQNLNMTNREYTDKWIEKCVNCSFLTCGFREDDRKFFLCCIGAEGIMGPIDNVIDAEDALRLMLQDEKNISKKCPDYFERVMDLYNAKNDK